MNDHNRKFLIFTLSGSLYALDLAQVAEVGDPPQLWPIPLSPPCYSGALNFHGDIVAVMDLAIFLGLAGPYKPGKIVVLQREIASLAFLVDTVVRIVSEDEVSFTPPLMPDLRLLRWAWQTARRFSWTLLRLFMEQNPPCREASSKKHSGNEKKLDSPNYSRIFQDRFRNHALCVQMVNTLRKR